MKTKNYMKFCILCIFAIFFISLISAIYPGETEVYINDLQTTELVWIVTENTSIMEVMPIVDINESNITITIPNDMPPNLFNIVFLFKKDNEVATTIYVTNTVSSGGGGGSRRIITKIIPEYVEVLNYITEKEYVENKTIEYQDREEYEKEDKIHFWKIIFAGLITIFVFCIVYLYMMQIRKEKKLKLKEKNIIERR